MGAVPSRSTRSLAVMPKCPHCAAPIPAAEVFPRALLLGGPIYRITCRNCQGRSLLPRSKRNIVLPLLILAIGAFATVSPVLGRLLPEFEKPLLAIIRAGIWSMSILAALAVFAFASQLKPAPDTVELGRSFAVAMLLKWIFWIAMVAWMYFIYRELTT
jgi:hypothetical protein